MNLTATTGSTRVTLTWQAVSGATGYRVFRATMGFWQDTPIATVSQPTFVNLGLTSGTPYTFKVAAFNSAGAGPLSGDVNATPMAPPTDFAAAAGDRRVTLTWMPSAGAWSYNVLRSTSTSEGSFVPVVTNLMALGFYDLGLTNGTKYYYRVSAIAPEGSSSLTAMVSATPLPPPPSSPPANLVAAPGNARVTLTWSAVDAATSYRIFRSTTGVFDTVPIATVTTTTFLNTGLTNGTAYFYRVVGRGMGGDGPPADVTATPLGIPAAPVGVTAAAGDRQVTLAWTLTATASGYKVYRGTRSGQQSSTPVATIAGPPFIDTDVENGPTYYYKVTAINVGGESPRSTRGERHARGPAARRRCRDHGGVPPPASGDVGSASGDVEHVKEVGADAFLAEQFAAPRVAVSRQRSSTSRSRSRRSSS